jgi:DNA-3-methyladenine glycosylase II
MDLEATQASDTLLTLQPQAPYDFLLLAAPYELPFPPAEPRLRSHGYTRPLSLRSGDVLCTLREQGDIDSPCIEIIIHDRLLDAAGCAEVLALVRHMTRADLDLAAFTLAITDDEVVAPLTRKWRGMKPFVPPTLFEALLWQLTGVRVYKAMAHALWQRLCRAYGTRLTLGDTEYFACPRPERLAECSYDELRGLRFSQQKSRYLVDLASAVASGDLDLEGMRDLPQDAFHRAIRAISGICGLTPSSSHGRLRPTMGQCREAVVIT